MFWIGEMDVESLGGCLLSNYSVSPCEITQTYIKPRAGTTFLPMRPTIGLKTISLQFDVTGPDRRTVLRRKSTLDAALMNGPVRLYLPDEYQYTALLQSAGGVAWDTPEQGQFEYVLIGTQHDRPIEVAQTFDVYCESTVPHTDCILRTTVGAAAATYSFCGVTFADVQSGDVLELDGVHKRVLINGGPGILRCDLVTWPQLVPGENHLVCPDPVTVQYEPTYL